MTTMDNASTLPVEDQNNGTSISLLEPNPLHNVGPRLIVGFLYTALSLFAIFGNILVCIVVIRRPKMRTVINLFIFNLAISDLLLCILGVPLTLFGALKATWILGLTMCRISSMLTACMIFVSSLTLTTIAVDRFCLVVYPFMKPIDKIKCLIAVIVIWVVSISFSLPLGVKSTVLDFTDYGGEVKCLEFWGNVRNRRKYTVALIFIQFVYPLIVVSIAHASIGIKLARTSKPGMRRAETDHRENKKRQRMNKMLSSVVFVFAVCWTPFNVYTLAQEYEWKLPHLEIMFIITYFLAVGSAAINPVLYAWLNDNFRKEFQKMLPCIPCFKETKPRHSQPKSSGGATASNVISRTGDRRSQPSLGTYLQPTCAESSVILKPTTHPATTNDKNQGEIDTPM